MTFKLGLTGSIGMGKSTTAQMFADADCDVWDADAAVHRLYAAGGGAVKPIADVFPEVIESGEVSRDAIKLLLAKNPDVLPKIEKIVHPLVTQDRQDFFAGSNADIVVFDIPLLFETGGHKKMDAVACVSTTPEMQRQRVMARGTMSEAQFDAIVKKQMPDSEKRERADYVIITDTLEHAREQVQTVIEDIRGRLDHA